MKKKFLILIGLIALGWVLFLNSYGDKRLASEKLFWQAEQTAVKLTKNKTYQDLSKEDLAKIIAVYRKVADKFPLEPLAAKAQFTIADIYALGAEYDKAQQELKKIIANFSSQGQIASAAQFAIGKVFELKGDPKKALIEYEKVSELYPLSSLGLSTPLYITQYYKTMNDVVGQEKAHRQAIRHYKTLIGDYSDTSVASVVQNYLAQAHLQGEEWSEAMKVWDEIIIKYPNTPQALRSLIAKAETRAKQLDDLTGAIAIYEDCLKKYPKADFTKELRLRLGNLYLESGQVNKAKEVFTSLMKDYPKEESLVVRSRLGFISCLKEEGQSQEVIKGYQDIKKNYPDNPVTFSTPYLVYRYYKQINDSENAKSALDTAISAYEKKFFSSSDDPNSSVVARLLFLCYAESKNWDKALNLLRTLSNNNPKDPGYLLSMALVYTKELGDIFAAKEIYKEIINKYSSNAALVKLAKEQIVALDGQATEGTIQE